jgi:hypothetical protein
MNPGGAQLAVQEQNKQPDTTTRAETSPAPAPAAGFDWQHAALQQLEQLGDLILTAGTTDNTACQPGWLESLGYCAAELARSMYTSCWPRIAGSIPQPVPAAARPGHRKPLPW